MLLLLVSSMKYYMNLSIIQRSHDTPYSKWEVELLAPFSISFTRTECSAGRLEAIETSRIKSYNKKTNIREESPKANGNNWRIREIIIFQLE